MLNNNHKNYKGKGKEEEEEAYIERKSSKKAADFFVVKSKIQMRTTMTSLPIVPSKFYQVCRLCLAVVNDTNDFMNLSVFGRHNASSCIDATSNSQSNAEKLISPVTASTNSSGVIVKANTKSGKSITRKSSTTRKSSVNNDSSEENDDDQNSVTDNTSENDAPGIDDDEQTIFNNNNNFKINTDAMTVTDDLQQSEILERIYTFLSITVSVLTFFFSTFKFSLNFTHTQHTHILNTFH